MEGMATVAFTSTANENVPVNDLPRLQSFRTTEEKLCIIEE